MINAVINYGWKWWCGFKYAVACLRNYYPCRAVAQRCCPDSSETIIIYTIFGKAHQHQATVQEILSEPGFIEKFKPSQAAVFGAIATWNLLSTMPENERNRKIEEMKKRSNIQEV